MELIYASAVVLLSIYSVETSRESENICYFGYLIWGTL